MGLACHTQVYIVLMVILHFNIWFVADVGVSLQWWSLTFTTVIVEDYRVDCGDKSINVGYNTFESCSIVVY